MKIINITNSKCYYYQTGQPGGMENPCAAHTSSTQLGFCWYEWNPHQTLQGIVPPPPPQPQRLRTQAKSMIQYGPKSESGNEQTDVNNNNVLMWYIITIKWYTAILVL